MLRFTVLSMQTETDSAGGITLYLLKLAICHAVWEGSPTEINGLFPRARGKMHFRNGSHLSNAHMSSAAG